MTTAKEEEMRLAGEAEARALDELETVYDLVRELDQGGAGGGQEGEIEPAELIAAWEREEVRQIFAKFPLPLDCEPRELLDFLDCDGDGRLQMKEFVKHTLRLLTNDEMKSMVEHRCYQARTFALAMEINGFDVNGQCTTNAATAQAELMPAVE